MDLWEVTVRDEKFMFNDEVTALMFAADYKDSAIKQITLYEDLESAFIIADLLV